MGNTRVGFSNSFQAIPYFAALGNEVVVRIDDQKRSKLFVVCHIRHGFLRATRRSAVNQLTQQPA